MNGFDAQKIVQAPQVFDNKFTAKIVDQLSDVFGAGAGDQDVVYIHQEKQGMWALPVYKERRIGAGVDKAIREQMFLQMMVPGSWSLFQPIKSFVQPTEVVGKIGTHISDGLMY